MLTRADAARQLLERHPDAVLHTWHLVLPGAGAYTLFLDESGAGRGVRRKAFHMCEGEETDGSRAKSKEGSPGFPCRIYPP